MTIESDHHEHGHEDPVEEAWCELLSAAEQDLAQDDPELALANCEAAIELLPDEPAGHLLRAEILSALGEIDEAVATVRAVMEVDEHLAEARTILGCILFDGCRFDEAATALQEATDQDPNDARAHLLLGALEERRGNVKRAVQLIRRAGKIDPNFRSVKPITEAEFESIVREVLQGLPEDVSEAVENLSVQIEAFPSEALLHSVDPPLDPFLLGLFRGMPHGQGSHLDGGAELPPTVHIFQRNLELTCGTREELQEQIAITVVHEIGHYLGLDEDDLAERGID